MIESKDRIARASTTIHAPVEAVWDALIDPDKIKQYYFGTTVVTDWREGNPIVWKGEWDGQPYEDKGQIIRVVPGETLQYSHFSPLTGQQDKPENYHVITIELDNHGEETKVSLAQDNNASEEDRQHAEENWNMMLSNLKQVVEGQQ